MCKVDISSGHSRENTEQAAFFLSTLRSFSAKELAVFKEEHSFSLDSPSFHAKQLSLKMDLYSCHRSCTHNGLLLLPPGQVQWHLSLSPAAIHRSLSQTKFLSSSSSFIIHAASVVLQVFYLSQGFLPDALFRSLSTQLCTDHRPLIDKVSWELLLWDLFFLLGKCV